MNIVANIGAVTEVGERDRAVRNETESLDAWLLWREGRSKFALFQQEENHLARQNFLAALEIDPDFKSAMTELGNTYRSDAMFFWSDFDVAIEEAFKYYGQVLEVDPLHASTLSQIAFTHNSIGNVDLALDFAERAVELDPNDYIVRGILTRALSFAGRTREAVIEGELSMRLSPFSEDWVIVFLGEAYFAAGDFEQAKATFEAELARPPSSPFNEAWTRANLALALEALGNEQEAIVQIGKAQAAMASWTTTAHLFWYHFKDPDIEPRIAETFRRLGLPD